MNAPAAIRIKLESCQPYYDRLVEFRPALQKPQADATVWLAAERCLHLALECAIDVGEMLISWKRLEMADENKDVFRVLGEAGILGPELAARMMRAAGLRNLLVHEYGKLDRDKLRAVILNDLGDLEAYAQAVLRSLDEGGRPPQRSLP